MLPYSPKGILSPTKFLEHPQRFLHPGAIGSDNLAGLRTLLLRRMGQTGSDIGGGGASLFVVLAMALTQLLSPVLEEFDQIEAVETEAGQSSITRRPSRARSRLASINRATHGSLWRATTIPFMAVLAQSHAPLRPWTTADLKAR